MEKRSKSALRKEFVKRRDAIDHEAYRLGSMAIANAIVALPEWHRAKTILLYLSIGKEVITHEIIEAAHRNQKRVVAPRVDPTWKKTEVWEVRAGDILVPGPLKNILEPPTQDRQPVSPKAIDLAIVPGLAFDRQGGRLGYGGGFFDRLLPLAPRARRVALAFDEQISATPLPMEAHDVPMHLVVTAGEIIRVK